jgi:hypothetical protein
MEGFTFSFICSFIFGSWDTWISLLVDSTGITEMCTVLGIYRFLLF